LLQEAASNVWNSKLTYKLWWSRETQIGAHGQIH